MEMKEAKRIKACPFCGGTDIYVEEEDTRGSYICCYDCLASFWQQEACSVEDNIEAWNRRAESKGAPDINVGDNGIMWQYCRDPNDINKAMDKHDENWEGLTSAEQIISITYDTNHGCYVVFWRRKR